MATKIEAINASRPKLVLNPTAKLDQVVDFIAMRTARTRAPYGHHVAARG